MLSFLLAAFTPALVLAGCATADTSEPMTYDERSPLAAGDDWIVLFDGSDLSHWRGFRRDDVPAAWQVEEGTLAFVPGGGDRGDIITRQRFADFDLELEWRISEGGNSGIMYRVGEERPNTWHTGPEMQILDDDRHGDGRIPNHRTGSLYDLVTPPEGIAAPVGEWNQVRIRVVGDHIQQWLNGHLTADVVIGSEEWNRRVAASKFRDMPEFASRRDGHIALQDHGDRVWFRNIRIRPIGGE